MADSGRQGTLGGRWLPPFGVQVASAAVFTTVFILWSRESWGGDGATVAFADLASMAVPAAAAWACWMRSRRSVPELRVAWGLLAAAALSWSLGQAYWAWHEITTGEPPAVPSIADAGYLLLIPFAALGVTFLVRRAPQAHVDPRPLLDGAIVGSSFIFGAFAVGLEAILLASEQTDAALIVNLLYPFGDGLILGVILLRLSRAPAGARGVIALLAAGFAMLAIADLWFLVVDAQGVYSTGGVLDAFWIMGFQLIGLAAIRPANLEAAVDAPPQSRALALVPLYPFFVSTGLAMYAEVRDGRLSHTLFWTALTVVMLVLARLIVMVFDNIALTRLLQAAQTQRTQMLNNITHDLVSPLSAVRIQLKLLAGESMGERTPKQDNALRIVDRNVDRVNRLSQDLKDLGNLEGKGLVVLPAPLDIAAEAARAVATFQAEATQRGVTLEVVSPPEQPMVGDAGRIGQVLDNLISNALKFTPTGGRVTVTLRTGNPEVHLEVTDTGRGLTPEEMARLFQPFSQVHQPGEVKERGTGLGLFISRGIATSHGGELTASSAGRGTGSTFRLTLPIAGPPAASRPRALPPGP